MGLDTRQYIYPPSIYPVSTRLVSRVSSFLCAREGGGLTSLHLAVLYNNLGLVRLLLADPRTQPGLKAVQSEVPTTEQGEDQSFKRSFTTISQ